MHRTLQPRFGACRRAVQCRPCATPKCLLQGAARRASAREASSSGNPLQPLPLKWSEVGAWAAHEFAREAVHASRPDQGINLGRACLLLALEEEAALELHPELEQAVRDLPIRFRSMASASTWSLERLEALAEEVKGVLLQELAEEQHVSGRVAAELHASEEEEAGMKLHAAEGGVAEAGVADGEAPTCSSAVVRSGGAAVGAAAGAAVPSRGEDGGGDDAVCGERSGSDVAEGQCSTNASTSTSRSRSGTMWDPDLVRQRPVQVLKAVNTVLFERQGYTACNRYGRPRDAQLSSVMESGVGCSAALSVLYMEVCGRLGLPMAAKPLEQGRYFVLWPEHQPLMANGQRFVVDPYGCGGFLLADEVYELFDVSPEQLWRPASRRQLLAALLGDLRDSHWARAAGCSATPGFITPLSLATALENKVGNVHFHSIRRAVAAAGKRLALLPDDAAAQLELALLHYFAGSWDDAWIELGILLERQQQGEAGAAAVARQQGGAPAGPVGEPHEAAATLPRESGGASSCAQLAGSYAAAAAGGPASDEADVDASMLCGSGTGAAIPEASCPEGSTSGMGLEGRISSAPSGSAAPSLASGLLQEAAGLGVAAAHPLPEEGPTPVGEGAWRLLDEGQVMQARVLLEKVRLQLMFSGPRGRA